MPSIITFELSGPTINKPFKFFDEFYRPDVLQLVRKNFFEALQPEHETRYLFKKSPDEDYVEIEYTLEDYDPENPMETYRSWQEIKKYQFQNELNELLKPECFKSLQFLEDRLDRIEKKDKKKEYLENEKEKILRHLNFIQEYLDSKYQDVCNRPLHKIIKTIYESYPSYAPKATKAISDILDKTPIDYTPFGLKTSLAKGILNYTTNGRPTFFAERIIGPLFEDINLRLVNFIAGEFEDITVPIEFTHNIEAVHYLIYRIARSNSFKLNAIEESKIITLKKGKTANYFKADTCSKGKSSFEKKNESLRREIDALILLHRA